MAELCIRAKKGNFIVNDLEDLFKPITTSKQSILYLADPWEYDACVLVEVDCDYTEPTTSNILSNRATITLDDVSNISINDTLLVQGVYGFDETGTIQTSRKAMLFVTNVDREHNQIQCYCINGKRIGNYKQCVPTIEQGNTIVLCAKVAGDTVYPLTLSQPENSELVMLKFLYSFYEDSSNLKGRILNYGLLNDTESKELRKFIMRKNFSYLFGVKGSEDQPNTMEGIWETPKKEIVYNEANFEKDFLKIFRKAFSGDYVHSSKKVILADSTLVMCLERTGKFNNKLEYTTAFGTLKYYYCPFLDEMGSIGDGLVVDPAYIDIYIKTPLKGNFNNGILTFTEESTVVMSNPRAHLRIIRS